MNWELLTVALMAGAANWAFRALPILARMDRMAVGGWLGRFLSSTGPAAIATLFVASILPALTPDLARLAPVLTGTAAVLATWVARRSVVLATLAGAIAHGVTVWLLG
ncbi:MAG: AzlD domain-containing protein [Tabrizicola sp.]|uniref:AzlD domain-containing protein n=1 Tax=Tabrizicola sp. TaxID=2005166 RepID=UPI002ABC2A7A|nr:AzlD domain-containing protein [Tabrizicola sp.]MDZ4087041.1 AzlD domain-containing protein [Tabrizicola sp.]